MAKELPVAYRINDLEARLKHLVWLPAAGLTFEHLPECLDELMEILPGEPDLSVVKALPALEPLTHEDEVSDSDLCAALEGAEGFLFLMETPKRRWFSDGGERMNWGDTYVQWGYAPDLAGIEVALTKFVRSVVEDDAMKHPRVFVGADDVS